MYDICRNLVECKIRRVKELTYILTRVRFRAECKLDLKERRLYPLQGNLKNIVRLTVWPSDLSFEFNSNFLNSHLNDNIMKMKSVINFYNLRVH